MIQAAQGTERRVAIAGWFFLNGFVISSWVAHIPRLSNALGATPGVLGLTLLCMAVGAVLGMTGAPTAVRKLGAGRAAWWAAAAFASLLTLPLLSPTLPLLALSLLLFGAANGVLGVAMNAAAADCERVLGRPVMSSFHGWFSIGMVGGVVGGVVALIAGLPPALHAVTVLALAAALLAVSRSRTVTSDPATAPVPTGGNHGILSLAGLAFVCLFLEGAMADWAGLLAATFGAGPDTAPLAYAAFAVAWAGGRFLGDKLTAAVGDVVIVRAGGLMAAAGVGLALLLGSPAGVGIGCGLAGLGLANAVPVLFRAAAARNAAGLALVSGVGYAGFLIGPPLVGFSADVAGLPNAMLLVVAGGILLCLGAAALRRKKVGIECRAVLFDMDGTLVDSSAVCDAVWKEWAARANVDPAPILAVHHGRRPEETLRLTYPELATDEAAAWLQARQIGWTDGVKPIAGAAALIDSLGHTSWAVVTSASRALAEERLRAVGLWRGGVLIGADDVTEGKPSPEGYLAAAKALGVNPAECVVVEDAPAGIEAGARAGMRVVAVATTHPASALATPHIVRDLAGVLADTGRDGAIRLVLTG